MESGSALNDSGSATLPVYRTLRSDFKTGGVIAVVYMYSGNARIQTTIRSAHQFEISYYGV